MGNITKSQSMHNAVRCYCKILLICAVKCSKSIGNLIILRVQQYNECSELFCLSVWINNNVLFDFFVFSVIHEALDGFKDTIFNGKTQIRWRNIFFYGHLFVTFYSALYNLNINDKILSNVNLFEIILQCLMVPIVLLKKKKIKYVTIIAFLGLVRACFHF